MGVDPKPPFELELPAKRDAVTVSDAEPDGKFVDLLVSDVEAVGALADSGLPVPAVELAPVGGDDVGAGWEP